MWFVCVCAVNRHATFVYSDGKVYNGHYKDSRVSYFISEVGNLKYCVCVCVRVCVRVCVCVLQRHGQGSMTWPDKTIYSVSEYTVVIHGWREGERERATVIIHPSVSISVYLVML